MSEALMALDGMTCRIAAASALADYIQSQDYVISNLRVLGLLKKGAPQRWGKASGRAVDVARTDYASFIRDMRRHGVEVKRTPDTLKFSFLISDLLDVVPISSRLEIMQISMSLPGKWMLTMAGILAKKSLLEPVERIFDALFFYRPALAKRDAEAKATRAIAKKTEAEARMIDAEADLVRARIGSEMANALLGYGKALESVVASLRNAGFRQTEIRSTLVEPVQATIATLSTLKASGLVEGIYLQVVPQPNAEGSAHQEGPGDANL